MSEKKIFIALSQREARSVLTAIRFITCGCSKKVGEELEFNAENAEVIGITAEELCELHDFYDRLNGLENQLYPLPEVSDDINCITFDKAAQDAFPVCKNQDSTPACRLPDEIPECYKDCKYYQPVSSIQNIQHPESNH